MKLTEERKKWIDEMSYEQLLSKWRFAPAGDTLFQGETGEYFAKVMKEKRDSVSNEEHVATSKRLGWEKT